MDSFPVSRVVNAQAEGIGRVTALRAGCAWNNLGRNVVFADSSLRPRGIFGDTQYPEDAEKSEFDLDVHAIIELVGAGQIAVLNHLGSVRVFDSRVGDEPVLVDRPNLRETRRLTFVDDLERTIGLGDRLVTSQPRAQRRHGVLVTEPVVSARSSLDAEASEESFGFVTALAARSAPDGTGWVALGGEGHVRVVETVHGRLGATRWEASVDFMAAVLVDSGPVLWAAGSDSGGSDLDDYDWERLGGGGLAELDLGSGTVLSSARFGEDLAWGSGGVALVVVDGVPCGVGRHGELHALAPGAPVTRRLTGALAPGSLGIAHAAVVGDQLVVGFNRGGYRLHLTPLRTVSQRARDLPLRRA